MINCSLKGFLVDKQFSSQEKFCFALFQGFPQILSGEFNEPRDNLQITSC